MPFIAVPTTAPSIRGGILFSRRRSTSLGSMVVAQSCCGTKRRPWGHRPAPRHRSVAQEQEAAKASGSSSNSRSSPRTTTAKTRTSTCTKFSRWGRPISATSRGSCLAGASCHRSRRRFTHGRVMLCRSIIAARAKISQTTSLTRKADGIASIASHQEESLDSNPLGPARFCTPTSIVNGAIHSIISGRSPCCLPPKAFHLA